MARARGHPRSGARGPCPGWRRPECGGSLGNWRSRNDNRRAARRRPRHLLPVFPPIGTPWSQPSPGPNFKGYGNRSMMLRLRSTTPTSGLLVSEPEARVGRPTSSDGAGRQSHAAAAQTMPLLARPTASRDRVSASHDRVSRVKHRPGGHDDRTLWSHHGRAPPEADRNPPPPRTKTLGNRPTHHSPAPSRAGGRGGPGPVSVLSSRQVFAVCRHPTPRQGDAPGRRIGARPLRAGSHARLRHRAPLPTLGLTTAP